MPNNLISCDYGAVDRIYKHSGISSTITDSFASPSTTVWGLTYDGTNLVSSDKDTDKIYKHSGISSTITDSFASPAANPRGLAFQGTDLISSAVPKIFRHSGISSTITDSFASPSTTVWGLTYDGTNLVSSDSDADKIYKHSGISSTITDSFASPGGYPYGLTYDGTNLVSCDKGTDQIYKHSGISSTITDSFASPSGLPSGLAYESLANQAPTAPTSLLCEEQSSPVSDVTDLTPEFSAIFNDPDSGDIANAVEIHVATTEGGLGSPDMWDSGWIDISAENLVEGNRCNDQSYAGSALSLDGSTYYWKVRFRDDDNAEGTWSSAAQFTMGTPAPPPEVAVGGLLSQIW